MLSHFPVQRDALRRWSLKGGIAIFEQALFSGSNFVLSILLARWLTPEAYGAFAIGFAVYLFLSGFQNALILEPMSVLATSSYRDTLDVYLAAQYLIHVLVTAALGAFAALVAAVLMAFSALDTSVLRALLAVGLFLPLMLLIWLVRRTYYVLQQPQRALACTAIYAFALFSAAWLVRLTLPVDDVFYWFASIGIAALFGSLPMLFSGRLGILRNSAVASLRPFAVRQWHFGKWLVIAAFLFAVGTQAQLIATAALMDLGAAGMWRAIQNFALPMTQVITAIATLMLPAMASDFGRADYSHLRMRGLLTGTIVVGLAAVYEIVLVVLAAPLERLLYGGKFAAAAWLIPVVGLAPLLTAVESGFSLAVRSWQRPEFHALYSAAIAAVAITLGPLLILRWGLAGAAATQVAVAAVSLAVVVYLYRAWFPIVGAAEE